MTMSQNVELWIVEMDSFNDLINCLKFINFEITPGPRERAFALALPNNEHQKMFIILIFVFKIRKIFKLIENHNIILRTGGFRSPFGFRFGNSSSLRPGRIRRRLRMPNIIYSSNHYCHGLVGEINLIGIGINSMCPNIHRERKTNEPCLVESAVCRLC